jgi:hypothetical protein
MKLLPFHTYSAGNILAAVPRLDKGKGKGPTKGKRKADEEELVGQSPTKKSTVALTGDEPDEWDILEMETD